MWFSEDFFVGGAGCFFGGVSKIASAYLCNIKNDVLYISICIDSIMKLE